MAKKIFTFEGFTLDIASRKLSADGKTIDLRPKSFDVLCCLVENAGLLVTKEQLLQAVWSDVTVGDDSIARCISDVRSALGDADQRSIKTLPRRGYIFVAPLHELHEATVEPRIAIPAGAPSAMAANQIEGQSDPGMSRYGFKMAGSILALVTLLVVAVYAFTYAPQRWAGLNKRELPAIAVLPFTDLSESQANAYLAQGIPEDISMGLGKYDDLKIIAQGTISKVSNGQQDPLEAARQIEVDYLLRGSVRREADHLRISTMLVQVSTGQQLWAEHFDSDVSGLFEFQDEISRRIIHSLVTRISDAELDRRMRRPPNAWKSYDYYLQAVAAMKDMRPDSRGATLAKARGLFEQALAKDSDYAGALQGLANTYLTAWLEPSPDHAIGQEFQRDEILQTALVLAERAVRADTAHAEAHAMLGWILYWKRRVPESIASFKRATELNPNLVDGRYAIVLAHGGRALEALAYMKKIMALDPYYPPNYPYYLGKAHFFLGDYDKAIELIRPATVRMPGNRPPLVLLAAVAAHTGDMEVAKSAAAEVLRLEPKFTIMSWIAFLRLTNDNDVARLRQGLLKAGLPGGTSVAKSIN